MSEHKWPDREHWAYNRTHLFFDERPEVSWEAEKYGTPAEVAAIVAALKARWSQLGRDMRTIKARIPELLRQPGETDADCTSRYIAMSEADQDRVGEYWSRQHRRRQLNAALKSLRAGRLPYWYDLDEEDRGLLQPLTRRYEAALKKAEKALIRERAATPVDDAAWEAELAWRRKMDEEGIGRIFHHYV
jgi:hypothetical protein